MRGINQYYLIIKMISVPFSLILFRGTVSVDISLKDVDINQCDSQTSSGLKKTKEPGNKHAALNTFLGTHRCKASTMVSIIF